MKKFLLISGALFVVLSACSSMSVVPFPEAPSIPNGWGQYDGKYIGASQCPQLQGQYSFPETKIVMKDGIESEERAAFADYFGLFPWALADKEPGGVSGKESQEFLRFDQPSEKAMVIELLLSGDQNTSHYYEFEALKDDFICEEGALKFPTRQSFGGIEGSTLNGQVGVSIRKAKDGALIVVRTYGIYRSGNVSDHSSFTHEFYRFHPSPLT